MLLITVSIMFTAFICSTTKELIKINFNIKEIDDDEADL